MTPFTFREAIASDITGMHVVRKAVRENALSSDKVREEHYVPYLKEIGCSWVALNENEEVLGFASGNKETGNIWALFVHPDYEGMGIGKTLHDMMIEHLFSEGLLELNLSTDNNTRAHRFYERAGWKFSSQDEDEVFFVLSKNS
jgi:ribosomal protein S18 acetylase RimI-like enzyme